MLTPFSIRLASNLDLTAILDIVNYEIIHGTANFAYSPTPFDQFKKEFETKTAKNYPYFVAVIDDRVIGFATYGQFRFKEGYNCTAELSIYIHSDAQNIGIGHALMKHLIDHAREHKITSLIAGIADENEGSIRFHENHKFKKVGFLPRVAKKFDRDLNLVFMQLEL